MVTTVFALQFVNIQLSTYMGTVLPASGPTVQSLENILSISWLVTCLCLACPPACLRQVLILVRRLGAASRVISLSLGVSITKAILNIALV